MSNNPILVTLSIDDKPAGQGNAGGGKYHYEFDPDVVHVTEHDTKIIYRLAEKDRSRYEVADLYSTDMNKQLIRKEISRDGTELSVIHVNTVPQLTVVSVRVKDRSRPEHISCDPQVTNDPPPVIGVPGT
jgi:hypothetical protein